MHVDDLVSLFREEGLYRVNLFNTSYSIKHAGQILDWEFATSTEMFDYVKVHKDESILLTGAQILSLVKNQIEQYCTEKGMVLQINDFHTGTNSKLSTFNEQEKQSGVSARYDFTTC